MTGEDKHIDKLFHDGLNGFREKPPVHSWSRLDHSLDVAAGKKKRMYYWLAAASVLIMMAFGAGYYFGTYLNQPAEIAGEKSIEEPPGPQMNKSDQIQLNQDDLPESIELAEQETDEQVYPPDNEPVNDRRDVPIETIAKSDNMETGDQSPWSPPLKEDQILNNRPVNSTLNSLAYLDAPKINIPSAPALKVPGTTKRTDVHYPGTYEFYPEDSYASASSTGSKWSVGAQFAPTYSYREISANYGTNLSGNQQAVEDLNNVEEGLLSYAGGMDVGFNFSKKWSVQSGVYFSRIGQVNSDALEFKNDKNEFLLYSINTSTGNINVAFERVPENLRRIDAPKDSIDMGSISDVKVIQNFDLFEVPLLIRYKFMDRKFSMNLTGGLSPAYLLGNNTFLETDENKYDIGDAGNLNSMIVNTSLGLGFEYLVTKKLSVNFEPTFKYSLNPINNSSNVNYHPYYFSWFTGIRLKIN